MMAPRPRPINRRGKLPVEAVKPTPAKTPTTVQVGTITFKDKNKITFYMK